MGEVRGGGNVSRRRSRWMMGWERGDRRLRDGGGRSAGGGLKDFRISPRASVVDLRRRNPNCLSLSWSSSNFSSLSFTSRVNTL